MSQVPMLAYQYKRYGLPKKKPMVPIQESSANVGIPNRDSKNVEDFKGDHVLVQSIALMEDIMWSRECSYAVADGDPGRVYEVLKGW
jgi:hypothetical protein